MSEPEIAAARAFFRTPDQRHSEELAALGALIRDRLRSAQRTHSDLGVSIEIYAAQLGRCAQEQPEAIAALRTDDLYLACACLQRSPAALARLHALLYAQAPALSRMRSDSDFAEDLLSEVEARLLIDADGRPAKLREYEGRGRLESWLRVVAVGSALKRRDQSPETAGHSSLMLRATAPDDPELEVLQERHGPLIKAAFERAFRSLSPRERNVLRLNVAHHLGLDGIARLYGVHRASAARWLASARKALTDETRRELQEALGLSSRELCSLVRAVRPRMISSIERIVREETLP